MKVKVILAAVALVLGIGLYGFSDYITEQVAIGRGQIYRGQKTVDSINSVIGRSTITQPFSGLVTGGAQDKINAGKQKVSFYDKLAASLRLSGIFLVILAAVLFIWGFFFTKKS